MAHFKRGNLQLKTNQQIQLGDSQESLIKDDGSDLILDHSSGNIKLYWRGNQVFQTDSAGIRVRATTGNSAELALTTTSDGNGFVQKNDEVLFLSSYGSGGTPGKIKLRCSNSSGSLEDGIILNGDGAVELFYDNVKTFETISTGIRSAVTAFDIKTSGGEDGITINNNGAIELFHNNVKQVETISTGIQAGVAAFDIKTSGGEDGITINNDGGVELFYNDVKTLETLTGEIRLWEPGGSVWFEQRYSGSDVFLQNRSLGGAIQLWARSGGGVNRGMATLSPNGGVHLFYQGVRQFETIATGIEAGDTITAFDIKTSGGDDGITINDGSSTELYHDNGLVLETAQKGIKVRDSIADDPAILYIVGTSTVGFARFSGVNPDYEIYDNVNNNYILRTTGGGTTEIYYNGAIGFETAATGMQAGSTMTAFDIKTSGGEDGITINNNGAVELFYDNLKKIETTSTGATVTGDLQLTGVMDAASLDYAKVGTPTYSTAQEAMDQLGSAGLIEGGIISLDGTTSINVTAGSGMLRTSNDLHAPLVFVDFPETLSIPIPGDDTKNIVVNYNSGTPIVEAIDPGTFNTNTYFILGQVGRAEDDLIISNLRQRISDFSARILGRLYSTGAIVRVGQTGLILGESADTNRYVTMTEGDVWALLDIESLAAINTGTGDDFTTIYRDSPSGYVETPGETQWDMVKYDNGSGTLQDLSKERFGVRWFWLIPSDENLFMVYGTGNWRSLAEAEAEPVPTDIPSLLGDYGILLGRIIAQKDINIAIEVSTSFDTTYDFSGVTDHGNLSNLGSPADDHTQYSLVTGGRDFTGTVGGIDPISATDFVTLQYMSTLGTDRTRLTYDGTTDLDISIEHIIDIKYAEFQKDLDAPPWKEGRVFWDKENHTFGVYNDVEDVTLQVGQESHLRVRNISGQMIPNGSPVYITGADEGLPTVDLAKSDNIDTVNAVTIATHDIDDTSNGYTTITGAVNEINTSGFSPGDTLYVSDSIAGVITNVRPKSPNIAHRVGVATDIGAVGRMVSDSHPAADQMQVLTYSMPLKGVVDALVPLTGTLRPIALGETTDITTPFAVSNQHLYIYVNSLTGSGNVSIVGAQLSEDSSVQDSTGEEIITIDQAGTYYQTSFKWWEIDSITIPPGISAIDYDYGVVGYPDMGNRNFSIIGYRCDAYADKDGADFSILIRKVQDDGNGKMSVVELENIGVDAAGDGIVDNLRTGADDRSYNPTVANLWDANTILTLKQLDFNNYFTSDQNDILSKEKDEGMLITIAGQPAGITDVDYIVLYLYYELLP